MGDAAAEFEVFIRDRGTHYLRLARAMSPSAAAAENLFQTAAERRLRRWSGLRSLENPDAYVRQILINASIDADRRRVCRPEQLVAAVPETAVADPDVEGAQVLEHLAALPAQQRAVVVLRLLEDLSTADTARVLASRKGR